MQREAKSTNDYNFEELKLNFSNQNEITKAYSYLLIINIHLSIACEKTP